MVPSAKYIQPGICYHFYSYLWPNNQHIPWINVISYTWSLSFGSWSPTANFSHSSHSELLKCNHIMLFPYLFFKLYYLRILRLFHCKLCSTWNTLLPNILGWSSHCIQVSAQILSELIQHFPSVLICFKSPNAACQCIYFHVCKAGT